MVFGFNAAVLWCLPMLGKHPDEYPRFRDCFLGDEAYPEYNGHIHVYTRTGGGNREGYEAENQAMRDMTGFVTDFDDDFDSTFASWVFEVPEKWKADFALIVTNRQKEISPAYREQMKSVYPKLAERIDQLFEDGE
jgi:hypothetical protein